MNIECLRSVGSLKLQVSFAECSLFYRALLQKRNIVLRSLLIVSTSHSKISLYLQPLQHLGTRCPTWHVYSRHILPYIQPCMSSDCNTLQHTATLETQRPHVTHIAMDISIQVYIYICIHLYMCPDCHAHTPALISRWRNTWKALQHAATHCDTLRHTTTHYSTLQLQKHHADLEMTQHIISTHPSSKTIIISDIDVQTNIAMCIPSLPYIYSRVHIQLITLNLSLSHTHTHAHIHTHHSAAPFFCHKHTYTYTYTYISMYMHTHTHTHTHVHSHTYARVSLV